MASTLRLSPPLLARVEAYAAEIGVSVSALVAIALADYVDARSKGGPSASQDAPGSVSRVQVAPTPVPAVEKPATALPSRQVRRQVARKGA